MKQRYSFGVPLVLGTLICLPLLGAQRVTNEISVSIDLTPYSETIPGTTTKLDMVPVKGGTLKMGEKEVEVGQFFIAKVEVPWEVFDPYLQSGPPSKSYDQTVFSADAIARPSKSYILPDKGWGHNGYPVLNVSWETAMMYCRWLSSVTKKNYRLPTVAEWEWACRGASSDAVKLDKATAGKVAWYAANSKDVTHPVGKKAAGALGLFDMYGNVGEWALNTDGKYVVCGGTFQDDLSKLTPTERKPYSPAWQETDPQMPKSRWWYADGPDCGFRVVCEP